MGGFVTVTTRVYVEAFTYETMYSSLHLDWAMSVREALKAREHRSNI